MMLLKQRWTATTTAGCYCRSIDRHSPHKKLRQTTHREHSDWYTLFGSQCKHQGGHEGKNVRRRRRWRFVSSSLATKCSSTKNLGQSKRRSKRRFESIVFVVAVLGGLVSWLVRSMVLCHRRSFFPPRCPNQGPPIRQSQELGPNGGDGTPLSEDFTGSAHPARPTCSHL
jgi:hypothetical protein